MEQIIDNSNLKVGDHIIITRGHGGEFVGTVGKILMIDTNSHSVDVTWLPIKSKSPTIQNHRPHYYTCSVITGTEAQVCFRKHTTVNDLGNFPKKTKEEV